MRTRIDRVPNSGALRIVSPYATWLFEFRWHFVGTLTFRYETGPMKARADFLRYVRRIEETTGSEPAWFYSIERGHFDGLHLHFLLASEVKTSPRIVAKLWRSGFAEVERYRGNLGAIIYVTKNISSDSAEWEISTSKPRRLKQKRRKAAT
jgi:hypothetical protein